MRQKLDQTCVRDSGPWDCGLEAKSALAGIVSNTPVNCHQKAVDHYGRVVAECFSWHQNINAAMVRNGWALASWQYTSKFVDDETKATSEQLGIWQGSFIEPWKWRRQQR